MFYKHLKSGKIYNVLHTNVINATNEQDGQTMILYKGKRKNGLGYGIFVREENQFNEKFKKLSLFGLVDHLLKKVKFS